MAVALNDIKQYVGAGDDDSLDTSLQDCLDDAAVLVSKYVGVAAVPEGILDRATLTAAGSLWDLRTAPNGIVNQQYATADGLAQAPMRVSRDPLSGVYKMLERWVLPF